MVKGQKSSASSGTRKKVARKQATKSQPADAHPPPAQPKEKKPKGKQAKALAKAEPKKKVYVPPPKPVKPQPDPLDAHGIAHQLPPELVVVLRALGKKDPVTKAKALDELNARWIDQAAKETAGDNGEGEVAYALVAMMPVWFHRLPVLFTHPARRIRLLAASVHAALLSCSPAVRTAAFAHLADSADPASTEASLGTWLLLAHDLDRVVVTQAERSWRAFVSYAPPSDPQHASSSKLQITPDTLRSITAFTERVLLDPLSVHAALNPAPLEALPPPPAARGGKGGKGATRPPPPQASRSKETVDRPKAEGDEEQDADKSARLRYAALGALRWILDARKALGLPLSELYPILRNTALWSALHPAARAPFASGDDDRHQKQDGFGLGQPQVRVAAWTLVLCLLQLHGVRSSVSRSDNKHDAKEDGDGDGDNVEGVEEAQAPSSSTPEKKAEEKVEEERGLEPLLSVLGPAVLRSAWVETDPGVRSAITRPVLIFLKEYPNAWLVDAEAAAAAGVSHDGDREDEEKGELEGGDEDEDEGTEDDGDESGEENDGEALAATTSVKHPLAPTRRQLPSPAYTDFLSYLALGCAGSPIEGYPSVLIVLSTIPSSIITASASASAAPTPAPPPPDTSAPSPPSSSSSSPKPSSYADALHTLFAAFWAAIDGRALSMSAADRKGPARAFLGAVLECLVFMVQRVLRSYPSPGSASPAPGVAASAEHVETEQGEASVAPKSELEPEPEPEFVDLPRLVEEQFARVWDALFESRRLRVDAVDAGTLVRGALGAFERLDAAAADPSKLPSGEKTRSLFDAAFAPLARGAQAQTPGARELAPAFLRVLMLRAEGSSSSDGESRTHGAVRALVAEAVGACLGACEDVLARERQGDVDEKEREKEVAEKVGALARWLDAFGAGLFEHGEFFVRADDLAITHAPLLLSTCPRFALAYLSLRGTSDRARGLEMWHALLAGVAVADNPGVQRKQLEMLLDADENGGVPAYVAPDPEEDGLDRVVEGMLDRCISGGGGGEGIRAGDRAVVRRVLARPAHFLSARGTDMLTHVLASALAAQVESALYEPEFTPANLDVLLDFVSVVLARRPPSAQAPSAAAADSDNDAGTAETLLPAVFICAYLLPRAFPALAGDVEVAKAVWTAWVASEGVRGDVTEAVVGIVKGKLANVVMDCEARARPEDVLALAASRPPGLALDVLDDLFPSRSELEGMLASLPAHAADPSIALLEPAILPPGPYSESGEPPSPTQGASVDNRGYGPYARVVSALLTHALDDRRRIANEETWVLPHALRLSVLVQDFIRVPGAGGGTVFGPEALYSDVELLVARAQTLATYVFAMAASADSDEGDGVRHVLITKACLPPAAGASASKGASASATLSAVEQMLVDVVECAKAKDEVRESRVLYALLQHLFADADTSDAEHWLLLARRLEKTAPQTALTIVAALTTHAPEPARLDRYRNELAADALGIKPAQAATSGLLLLRRLVATAPDPESDVVFLPQQRAVNLMRVCQAWIAGAGDDDDEEEDEDEDEGGLEGVESVMTLLFYHLAPIVQNVAGAHWDLVWDVVENNLENCSFDDDATLTTLGRSLRLIILIEDLVKTNKSLKAVWAERRSAILSLVKDLVSAKSSNGSNNAGVSAPRSLCRELAVSIVQDMPSELVNENTLSEMCHFLSDPSAEVQKMSYRLLHEATRKRTEHLVVEAAVDTENKVKIGLPDELVVILHQTLDLGDVEQDASESAGIQTHRFDVFGHMLGWMVAFDLFEGASLKVRTGYVQHLRSLGVVGKNFIPHIFEVLNLFDGRRKPFKLSIWEVDGYHLDYYDPDDFLSIRLFAAHLYHRALLTIPVLVRSWISDCTDKQLLSRVLDFTSSFFSPGIIRAELALVRQALISAGGDSDGTALDDGENVAIRVSNVAGEATASYTIDDQVVEFAVRMPQDWPLHRLTIRDTRMPGVSEERWRAWVLGVQQTVWQQNGHIVDGLSMFTKNVKLHFAGLVECAICYSIICAIDGSIPAKPCRTCKNRFHAACLYKWFESSHASSCPLCRSDIL
ncbi:hypothetical protein CONPUDRAFT_157270 [Coniophora puteana RWD-64-598 SS2]|uniref:E3 ubiquitin-protein ligase listerin n=1 Tax=Coniophora puteana (strain RWD-64-598) TaxID=741705 RepID=A0A5M3MDD5_CONPW|nr:uncharacterized protein CONPUDRAFT_157270 [Coniophora puteana RWD-64-598 SS2]EIW76996.1 hypothetical protein CONPUDRAFT_157270 [Coniophora puteana RWD-64-598 SS2]